MLEENPTSNQLPKKTDTKTLVASPEAQPLALDSERVINELIPTADVMWIAVNDKALLIQDGQYKMLKQELKITVDGHPKSEIEIVDLNEECRQALQNPDNITLLRLSGTSLDDTSMAGLLQNAFSTNHQLQDLSLSYNVIGSSSIEALTKVAQNNPGLKLNLAYCQIEDSAIEALSIFLRNSSIAELNLANNNFTNIGAAKLSLPASVVKLILTGSRLDDLAMAELLKRTLSENHQLKELRLNNNKIGLKTLEALAAITENNGGLKLHLGKCDIGDEGIDALKSLLASNHLTSLDLTSNKFTLIGATKLYLAGIETKSTIILDFFQTSNYLSFEGLQEIYKQDPAVGVSLAHAVLDDKENIYFSSGIRGALKMMTACSKTYEGNANEAGVPLELSVPPTGEDMNSTLEIPVVS